MIEWYNYSTIKNTRNALTFGYMTKALGGASMNSSISAKVSGIYKITNTINGHIYVGSSVNIKHRWEIHVSDLNKNKHHSLYLQRAWNKYGEGAFEFSILETCFVFVLIFREQYYIDNLKPVYNISQKAGSVLGVKRTAETLAKMRLASKGRLIGYKHSEESRKNMSVAASNMTPEHKKNISETHKGMGHTQETRARISAVVKSLWDNPEYRKHMSEAHQGQTPSAETIAKRSVSLKAAWARRKAKKNE